MTPLCPDQQAQVRAILSKYDPKTLTADQAKAIHEAFRQADLRAGPAMADTIRAAGFDPERLRELAPPPSSRRSEAETEDRRRDGSDNRRSREVGNRLPERPDTDYSTQSRHRTGFFADRPSAATLIRRPGRRSLLARISKPFTGTLSTTRSGLPVPGLLSEWHGRQADVAQSTTSPPCARSAVFQRLENERQNLPIPLCANEDETRS
jgi:hypothetical protein